MPENEDAAPHEWQQEPAKVPAAPADEHGHAAAHGDHGHDAHDDHGHGHGQPAGDIIPENSVQDLVLKAVAMGTLVGLIFMMLWFYQEGGAPAEHHGNPPIEHSGTAAPGEHGAAPANSDGQPHTEPPAQPH